MIVKADMDGKELYNRMLAKWKIKPPNLLISVTGGTGQFHMTSEVKDAIRHGLVMAAQSTGISLSLRVKHVRLEIWCRAQRAAARGRQFRGLKFGY